MTRDTLDRLRAADPARNLDPDAPDDLLVALTAAPRRTRRRRANRLGRALVALTAAAAVAVGVAFVAPGAAPDLAAEAYAQMAPDPERILYVRTRMQATIDTPGRDDVEASTTELWQRAGLFHRITRYDGTPAKLSDETLDADGVLRLRSNGDERTLRPEDGDEQRQAIIDRMSDFVTSFRRDYERGHLDESGDVTFAGRPARRYVVASAEAREEYYLDAETGAPLGSKRVHTMHEVRAGEDGTPRPERGTPSGTATYVTVVEALDHLPPTEENLAKVDG